MLFKGQGTAGASQSIRECHASKVKYIFIYLYTLTHAQRVSDSKDGARPGPRDLEQLVFGEDLTDEDWEWPQLDFKVSVCMYACMYVCMYVLCLRRA